MRPRRILAAVLVLGFVVLWVGQAGSASARQPRAKPLKFITAGLSCTHGVCALGSGSVGANYGQDIAITGGSCGRPCVSLPVFAVVAGSLPPGLMMPRTYGCCGDAIGGTPTQDGAFTFMVQAQDGAGDVARQGFSIRIRPRPGS